MAAYYVPGMADVRELVRTAIHDKGLSMKGVSERIGKNHAYIKQYLGGKPEHLPEDVREVLGPLLNLDPNQLRTDRPGQVAIKQNPYVKLPPIDPRDKIPVMGIGEGGQRGWSIWNGEIVDYIQRPASLQNCPNGYAVYVVGSSMEPRYIAGETIYVHPGRPVTAGNFVLVQLKPTADGEPPAALIKRLVRKTGLKYVLEQFNPAETFDIPIGDVVSIHKIVGSGGE